MPPHDTAVLAEGLTKVYPSGTTAVDGLDLSVRRGEVFALLGPNGAGKSTTVGMLTTGVVPTAGRAWVAGIDGAAQPATRRRPPAHHPRPEPDRTREPRLPRPLLRHADRCGPPRGRPPTRTGHP